MCCKRENTGLIGRSALNHSTLWSLALHETGASSAVQGRHFQPEIIILCLRHYLRWALSLRNLEIMSKRNLNVDHVTIRRRINVMRRNSVHVVSANYGGRMDPGPSTKRIFVSSASGPDSGCRWRTPSISCSCTHDSGAVKRSFRKHYDHQTILVLELST
jgi:hypothetical protein